MECFWLSKSMIFIIPRKLMLNSRQWNGWTERKAMLLQFPRKGIYYLNSLKGWICRGERRAMQTDAIVYLVIPNCMLSLFVLLTCFKPIKSNGKIWYSYYYYSRDYLWTHSPHSFPYIPDHAHEQLASPLLPLTHSLPNHERIRRYDSLRAVRQELFMALSSNHSLLFLYAYPSLPHTCTTE